MRYGSIPLVRHTGGLADTVKDEAETDGNGFVVANHMVSDMLEAIERAEASFYRRAEWHNLIRRNLKLASTLKPLPAKPEDICPRAAMASRAHQW